MSSSRCPVASPSWTFRKRLKVLTGLFLRAVPCVLLCELLQQSDGLVRHIYLQQPYNHILHTVISHHIVSQLCPLISIVGQDSDQSLVYKDGFHHSFRHRQFECLLPRASSEHSIIRSSTSYF